MLPLRTVDVVSCAQVHDSARRTERRAFERKGCSPLVLSLGEFKNQDCNVIDTKVLRKSTLIKVVCKSFSSVILLTSLLSVLLDIISCVQATCQIFGTTFLHLKDNRGQHLLPLWQQLKA